MTDQPKTPSSFKLFCTSILFLPCMLLAKLASQTRINVVTVDDANVSKRRSWHAFVFRIPGNMILGLRHAPIKVLSTKQWLEREKNLSNATCSNRTLILEKIDGIQLCEFLANEDSAARKLSAITTAMRSLFDFHLQHEQSHGDASATNVIINELPDGKLFATWFDFDVAHKESVPEVVRRSDDLRALLFTSKPWLSDTDFARLFEDFDSCYQDEDVWNELIRTMSNPFQHCDIFHIAQQKRALESINNVSNI